MLFTDSDIVTLDMLQQIDSEIDRVASSAKPPLVVEGAGSCIRQAWQECGSVLLSAQQLYSTYLAQPGMSSAHVAAVMNTGVPARNQPRVKLSQIVAHHPDYAACQSAVQQWMAYHALALLFRNASVRTDKDRY